MSVVTGKRLAGKGKARMIEPEHGNGEESVREVFHAVSCRCLHHVNKSLCMLATRISANMTCKTHGEDQSSRSSPFIEQTSRSLR